MRLREHSSPSHNHRHRLRQPVIRKLCESMKEYFGIHRIAAALFAMACLVHTPPAQAAQQLVLVADQTQIVKLPESPATVVVGNPSVADVTTEGNTLFFHPRGFGLTNVVALDTKGHKLADYLVRVVFEDNLSVSMYGPDSRRTFTCRKDCEPVMRIGDQPDFFGRYSSQTLERNAVSAGQALGEDLFPRPTAVVPNIITGVNVQ